MKEIWKDIPGYEGLYQVSNLGRVKSLGRKTWCGKGVGHILVHPVRIMKPCMCGSGYLTVYLTNREGVHRRHMIHRLVALAFIPNDNLFVTTVNHKNEVKTDNRVDNLEWMTMKDNAFYSNGRSRSPNAKRILCTTTGEEFKCMKDFADAYGLRYASLVCTIWRGANHLKGYSFKLLD